jgi:2-polyprenyl-3-methyl-5-hydroxy-6-metoxy-1,4-benzoquinol methylase
MIDTKFQQDLSEVSNMIEAASVKNPWIMGHISDGQEWLAVTFRSQEARRWSETEFDEFMRASDEIAIEAYERMSLSRPEQNHPWARPEHAQNEIEYLIGKLQLSPGSTVVDFGCGSGRHSIALTKAGYQVVGIDFSKTAIGAARSATAHLQSPPEFIEGDCRKINLARQFDAGICLYDVVGSFPEWESNEHILRNLVQHVKPGGRVAVSVMSYDFTASRGKQLLTGGALQDALLTLPPSTTMQGTGDVFDGDLMVIDPQQQIIYRKETFDLGDKLPIELIVRDRRFTKDDIQQLCKAVGLTPLLCGHVRAGSFALADDPTTQPTREILFLAEKSLV